jgi:ribonuclease R
MNDMKPRIVETLGRKDYVPANVPELLQLLRLPPAHQQELQRLLAELEKGGQIVRLKGNRYIESKEADLIPGRIRMNRQGKGFLQPDDTSLKEIAIAADATGTALHEDRVLVRREVRPKGLRQGADEPATGAVVRILERRRTQIVGTLQCGRQFLYVVPDDPRIPHDIYVPEPRDVGRPAHIGDKVVVELRDWESRHTNPEGEIIEVLGQPDAEGVDMLSVLRQYDLPLHFPKAVLHEAEAIGRTVDPQDVAGRVDCRRHQVVTIDPDDAKDFDDAICLERVSADQWRLWVHIADVSHYVKPGTALDTEARKRGNSTYLVDRVIPMLPEALSNELCSLKPVVDRLTKCVEFLISDAGHVLSTKFYPAVIHSQRRFTYAEVMAILQRPPAPDAIEQMLHDANDLTQRIRRLRFKAGSLDLDFPETKIRLNEQGHIRCIERTSSDESHQLIEECMLLANEAVAARLMSLNRPAIYRVHEVPDERRLQEYRQDVLSQNVPCGNLHQPAEVQKLLQRLNGLPAGPALKIGFLKSLMRARYAVEPLGHYGLAKKKYTHFTSPIRRYADLVVHRALFDQKRGQPSVLKETAEHISVTERNSADAERDSKDVKLFAFLNAQLKSGRPEPYPALVTDVRNFGFFVDVPGLAMSGLVPLSTVEDDFFVFDETRNHLIGRRTRRIIRLGDAVTVQVARVDTFKKQVDFRLTPTVRPLAGRAPVRPPVRQAVRQPARPPARQSGRPPVHQPNRQSNRPPNRPPTRQTDRSPNRPQGQQSNRPPAQQPARPTFQTSLRPALPTRRMGQASGAKPGFKTSFSSRPAGKRPHSGENKNRPSGPRPPGPSGPYGSRRMR